MGQHKKPIRWDDSIVRHDPKSLPFLGFYLEVQEAARQPAFAARAEAWLQGRSISMLPQPSPE